MKHSRLFNALGITLAAVIMAAGLIVPAKLLKKREEECLKGEWSFVSIGEVSVPGRKETVSETPNEKRLMDVLAFAAAHGEDSFLDTGLVYYGEAHSYFAEQTFRLIDTGTLPYELGLFVSNSSKISTVSVSGDVEHGFLTDGVTRPAGEASEVGLTALSLWLADGQVRGKVDVTADSVTGRVIDLSIRVRGLTMDFEEEPNGYSMLWAYASYLGLTAQDGFTGSIEGSKVTMRFGCGAVLTLEASFKQNMIYYHIRAFSEAASVSGESERTGTAQSPKNYK